METKQQYFGLNDMIELLSVGKVAKLLNKSKPTIYNMIEAGRDVRFIKGDDGWEVYEVIRLG